jgi:hypothetical protein
MSINVKRDCQDAFYRWAVNSAVSVWFLEELAVSTENVTI